LKTYIGVYILQEGDVYCLDFYWAGFKGDMFRSLFGKGPYVRERASLGSDALAFRTNYFPNVLFFSWKAARNHIHDII